MLNGDTFYECTLQCDMFLVVYQVLCTKVHGVTSTEGLPVSEVLEQSWSDVLPDAINASDSNQALVRVYYLSQ